MSNTNFNFILSLYIYPFIHTSHPFPSAFILLRPEPSSLFKKQFTGSQILGPSVLTPTWRWLIWLSAMDSLRVLSIDGFRTKPEVIHSVDVYPILVKQPWYVALSLITLSVDIKEISGPGWEINIFHLQEIVMGFVCLELVSMKEPPNPLHHQPFYRSL